MTKQGPLRVAIAGYGVVGKRRREHIDSFANLQTVAVCDRTVDGDGVFDDGVRYFHSYKDLLQTEIDILFVCLTNDVAAEVTIAGLERGLHVFCEKPPGRTVSDIRRVIACEKNHPGQKLKYGFNHRYHESVRDALELVEAGAMGRMINLRGVYGKSKLITFDQSDWRTKREIAGGGVLLDQGIHMADLMRLFAGEFHTVHSFVSNEFWNFDVEDNAYALMRSENRVVAMLHSSATQWQHRFRMEMTLEKGALILSGILSGSKSYGNETLTVVRLEDGPQGVPRENTTQYHEDPSWADEIAEFADCIVSDESVRNGSSEDALRTMELVYRIYDADPEWREKLGTF